MCVYYKTSRSSSSADVEVVRSAAAAAAAVADVATPAAGAAADAAAAALVLAGSFFGVVYAPLSPCQQGHGDDVHLARECALSVTSSWAVESPAQELTKRIPRDAWSVDVNSEAAPRRLVL
ncbi:hypothetical protein ACSSS7_007727 [Eimeria intestinalis]